MKLIQVGVGPVGQRTVRYALERSQCVFIGAVDPDPAKAGRDLGEVCGVARLGVKISSDLKTALKGRSADAALLTTVSSLSRLAPQAAELARAKLNVVSTCEELSYPWLTQPEISDKLDKLFKKNGVTCLGTGVNPGFLMDFLPAALTGVSQRVDKIVVRRVQDASVRRIPFQQKIGAGLTRAEFRARQNEGILRHVGLTESMHMIAARLGWALDRTTETLRPVIAKKRITSGYKPIEIGQASGVEQAGRAWTGRKNVIALEFLAAVGELESYDSIEIAGMPGIRSVIAGGVNGDIATSAIAVNALPVVVSAPPGLKTMIDLPVITSWR